MGNVALDRIRVGEFSQSFLMGKLSHAIFQSPLRFLYTVITGESTQDTIISIDCYDSRNARLCKALIHITDTGKSKGRPNQQLKAYRKGKKANFSSLVPSLLTP